MNNHLDINILKEACLSGNVQWTIHILEKMQERDVEPSDVISCISTGTIIELYPDAFPYPACLVLGTTVKQSFLHVVVGYGGGYIWIVTVYEPNEREWENGFTTRKR